MTEERRLVPVQPKAEKRRCWRAASINKSSSVPDDPQGWLKEAARYRNRVAAYIRRTVQDRAEVDDLLADTWANAWCEHVSGSKALPTEHSLISHARIACTKWKAARRYEVEFPRFGLTSPLRPDGEDVKRRIEDEWNRTFDWMLKLPRQQFYALVFRLLRGAEFEMVAAAMGCSVSAAKTHYSRAIAALKRRRATTIASEHDDSELAFLIRHDTPRGSNLDRR
jgi:DNA-directed RNA polymerase specialized sigma24 family protein